MFYKAVSSTKGNVVISGPGPDYMYTPVQSSLTTDYYPNVEACVSRFPSLDVGFTIFCGTQTQQNQLQSFGFPLTYLVENGEIITFNNGSRIEVDRGLLRMYTASAVYPNCYNTENALVYGIILPAPSPSFNDYVNTTYNHNYIGTVIGLRLENISANGFRLNLAMAVTGRYGLGPYANSYISTGVASNYDKLVAWYQGLTPEFNGDPYAEIPQSGPSTPSGTYDFSSSDAITFPTLPQLSAVSTGFISLWSPTEEQMLKLSSFMWNANPLTIDFWKKIVADPMKLIYGLNIIPLDLEEMGLIDGEGTVVVGLIDTGVLMNHLSAQWVELDCGSITLDETWSAYLDYDPYTKLEVYLPYCGTHPLKVDDFMPGTISLKYHIDLLSGACVAILVSTKSDKHGDTLNSVVYQFMGNCASQLPVTSEQYADAVRSVIQLAASIGTMVALGAGGAGAGAAVASTAMPTAWGHFDSPLHTTSALSTQVAGLVPAEDMGPIDWRGFMPQAGAPSLAETASQAGGTLRKIGGIHAASAAVENVMGIKPNIERSGAIGSTGGLLSVQTPYIILTRPRQARPEDQNKYTGYPSFITETLGDLEGWTIVQAIHLENIACTAEELAEIDELLKSGVIF